MGLIDRLFGKRTEKETTPTTEIIDKRRWQIQSILGPLVSQKIIDSKKTVSNITEILVNMGDPKLKQDAVKMIAGIMYQLSNDARKEFFLAVAMALRVAYDNDSAITLSEAIVEEHSSLVDS